MENLQFYQQIYGIAWSGDPYWNYAIGGTFCSSPPLPIPPRSTGCPSLQHTWRCI